MGSLGVPVDVNVLLLFHPKDIPTLHATSKDSKRGEKERRVFAIAAIATENNNGLLIQTMTKHNLSEIVALFQDAGVTPIVEDLRLPEVGGPS